MNREITKNLMTVCYSSEKSVNNNFFPGCSKSNCVLRGKFLCQNILEQFWPKDSKINLCGAHLKLGTQSQGCWFKSFFGCQPWVQLLSHLACKQTTGLPPAVGIFFTCHVWFGKLFVFKKLLLFDWSVCELAKDTLVNFHHYKQHYFYMDQHSDNWGSYKTPAIHTSGKQFAWAWFNLPRISSWFLFLLYF